MESQAKSSDRTHGRGVVPAPGACFEQQAPVDLVLLGATGSIGTQTLDICRRFPERIRLVAVAANRSLPTLVDIVHEFPTVRHVAIGDESLRSAHEVETLSSCCEVTFGHDAVCELAGLEDATYVLNALSGFAGMRASAIALKSDKVLALANKESLVAAGDILMPLASPGKLLPVDSEHSAIFQSMLGEDPWEAEVIWLTASGGPFFGKSRDDLAHMSASQALRHPNWSMGKRITIDSSTMMNKGLEIIEAHHLFDFPYDGIRPVVQRQSAVHSMVEFSDGTVKAHLGPADMRIPIQYALSFPARWPAPCAVTDWSEVAHVDFAEPDPQAFGCLRIAIEAGKAGGTMPCAMNAADEVAVSAYLQDRIGFLDIEALIDSTLSTMGTQRVESLEQLEEIDATARRLAQEWIDARI